jgi:dTDP-4-amino-4,6-dideoxygalactose transaminase
MNNLIKKHPYKIEEHLNRIYLVPNARIGLECIFDLMNLNKRNKILLPSYIGITKKEGSGIFDPVRRKKIGFEFYKINKNLAIDMKDFSKKIESSSIKAALVVHYFGFVQCDLEKIVRICKNNKVFLIEDCAHAFMSKYRGRYLGTFGDASVFSLHKTLPIPNGGLLIINNKNLNNPRVSNYNIPKKIIELLYRFDMRKIIEIRRKNYICLVKKISKLPNIQILYKKLPRGIVPLNLPILIKNVDRNEIYFKLLHRKIETTSLYYQLINQINKKKFPISYYISNHILNLPIHQDITAKDIEYMARVLKEIMCSKV